MKYILSLPLKDSGFDHTVLTDYRQRLLAGKLATGASLDKVRTRVGADAAWLQPLVTAATEVKDLPPPHPIPYSRCQLVAANVGPRRSVASTIDADAISAAPGLWVRFMAMFAPALRDDFHVAALAASILIAFLAGTLLSTGVIFAAQQRLPGDSGYGLKRAIEGVQLGLTFNPARREYLQAQFNDRRQFETEPLLKKGRET